LEECYAVLLLDDLLGFWIRLAGPSIDAIPLAGGVPVFFCETWCFLLVVVGLVF
jgi:hypothetical protein